MFSVDAPEKHPPDSQARPDRNWVEIVDAAGKPLAVLDLAEATRQALPFRAVAVLTYSANHKLFLRKRKWDSEIYPGLYDISVLTPTRPNESSQEAAGRDLAAMGLGQARLHRLSRIKPCAATHYAWFTVFSTVLNPWPGQLNAPAQSGLDDGLLVDKEEWLFMLDHYKETLSPFLLHFWDNKLLFA